MEKLKTELFVSCWIIQSKKKEVKRRGDGLSAPTADVDAEPLTKEELEKREKNRKKTKRVEDKCNVGSRKEEAEVVQSKDQHFCVC